MSIEDAAARFGMDVVKFPCERCGEMVTLAALGDWSKAWADGVMAVLCMPCGLVELPL